MGPVSGGCGRWVPGGESYGREQGECFACNNYIENGRCRGMIWGREGVGEWNIIIIGMGAEQSAHEDKEYRVRHRTLDTRNPSNQSRVLSRYDNQERRNSSFATPPINNSISYNLKPVSDKPSEDDNEDSPGDEDYRVQSRKQHRSIEVTATPNKVRYREATPKKTENDRILEALSKKNEALRKELKTISDSLTEQLKRKKFVPKKKGNQEEQEGANEVSNKQAMGLKRELENAYKQIDMYKRTIENLKGREEGDSANYKLERLTNEVSTMDAQIQKYLKKIEGVKRVKNKQDVQIEKDINDDVKDSVASYKREAENLKAKLKDLQNRDRLREANYKKQQAYLCDLERKAREINGEYFPEIHNSLKKDQHRTLASEKDRERVNPQEFLAVKEEAAKMRLKHEEYYRKIDVLLVAKNRGVEDQNDLKEQVLYKERIIEALKIKIEALKKILKPARKGLFGSGESFIGSEMHSEYDTPSQLERQLQEQLNQDQFDIKHLIANIPKPIRKRPQELSNGYSSGGISDSPSNKKGGGMVVTSVKAQPKKWGGSSTRTEERGKHFQGELNFEDRAQFEEDVQPLIVGMNVWVNKNNSIVGMQAIYMNKQELRYGVKSCDAAEGLIRRFDLQSPDYLKNLNITINEDGFVESMALVSKQGKSAKFGNKREVDENVNFGLANNERPFMFLGATTLFEGEPRLNLLGVEICNE